MNGFSEPLGGEYDVPVTVGGSHPHQTRFVLAPRQSQ